MECVAFFFGVVDALGLLYKFVRSVRRKVGEPIPGTESLKRFGLWTWLVFMSIMLAAYVFGMMVLFLTRSIEAGLGVLALGATLAVFVWLIWAIVPALAERIREYLKKHFE